MSVLPDLLYTKEHEWIKIQGQVATIGITDYAQKSLGDIVYCELPQVGAHIKQFATLGVVESVKAVSDLYAPITGEVLECNKRVIDDPALINQDPYQAAWMLKVQIKNPLELQQLLDATAYQALVTTA